MKLKVLFLILGISLISANSFAQSSLLDDLKLERSKFGSTVTSAQVALILDTVAWKHKTEGWGLLLKPNGAGIKFLDKQIAGDILFNSATSHAYDVLVDWENTAQVVFNDIGVIELSRFQSPIDPSLLGGTTNPTEPNQPTNPTGLNEILKRLDRLELQINGTQGQNERIFDNSTEQRNEIKSVVLSLSEQLRTHDERVGRIEKIFKSWQTYLIGVAPVLGYYLPKLGNNQPQATN